jgi:uncharacterized protein involved in tolerance to divalent cations
MAGSPGISLIELHLPDSNLIEMIMENLFYDNLVADVQIIRNNIHRSYLVDGKIVTEDGDHQVFMMTSDSRLEDCMAMILEKTPNKNVDMVVKSPATGNKNYIQWVKD